MALERMTLAELLDSDFASLGVAGELEQALGVLLAKCKLFRLCRVALGALPISEASAKELFELGQWSVEAGPLPDGVDPEALRPPVELALQVSAVSTDSDAGCCGSVCGLEAPAAAQ